MKTIGMLGGMSWESSIEYYRIINETVKVRLGRLHSAKSIMYSVDFAEIEKLQHADDWEALTQAMIEAAKRIEMGGADVLLICTNTMHKMAPEVADAVGIPLLHITDATAMAVEARGLETVGLLGTRFTMKGDFYRVKLEKEHGLKVLIPDEEELEIVHRIIYDELVKGIIREESRKAYLEVIDNLQKRGAQGVILGCTEIPLLVKQKDVSIPIFDTTTIHAQAAVDWALVD